MWEQCGRECCDGGALSSIASPRAAAEEVHRAACWVMFCMASNPLLKKNICAHWRRGSITHPRRALFIDGVEEALLFVPTDRATSASPSRFGF